MVGYSKFCANFIILLRIAVEIWRFSATQRIRVQSYIWFLPCGLPGTNDGSVLPRFVFALATAMLWLGSVMPSSRLEGADRALAVPQVGRAGFSLVGSTESKLVFTNTLAPMDAALNQNLMNGSGVAAGDFDGDGKCDLYFSSISGTNALFRNLGNWQFENVTETAGVGCGGWRSTGAVFVDIDGDGDLDLLVSTLGSGVHCFINDGHGHYTETTSDSGLASSSGSMSMALGDVDGDGDLDLYVANYGAMSVLRSGGRAEVKQINGEWVVTGPFANRLRYVNGKIEEVGEVGVLYLNDGHGHFSAVPWNSDFFLDEKGKPKQPPADYGLSVQIRDINGDGFPDIYTCNDFQTPDRLWLNNGHGHFREASRLAMRKTPFSSMGVDFADIDRDGQLDFLVVEMAGRTHSRRMRQVSGIDFLPNIPGNFDYRPEVNRNTLFRGNGGELWSEIAEFAGVAATDWSWQPVFLDVDLDGYEDLLVASGMLFDTQDRDTLARIQARGKISTAETRTALLQYPAFPSPIAAFRNRGNLTFEDRGLAWGFGVSNVFQGVALADLDGDGDLDLAFNCLNGGAILYRNETAAPRIMVRLKGLAPNTQGIGARIRVTGGPVVQSQEIISGGRYLSGDDPVRTFAAGGAAKYTIEITWRSGKRTRIDDALPNHAYEIVETGSEDPAPREDAPPPPLFANRTSRFALSHSVELYDDFARQPLLPKHVSDMGPGAALVDLAGDGNDDLIVGAGQGSKLQAVMVGTNRLVHLASDWIAPDDLTGMAGWVDAAGHPALLAGVSNYKTVLTNEPRIVLVSVAMAGSRLEVSPLPGLALLDVCPGPLAVADYDGDGDLDLFVGGRVSPGAYPQPVSSKLFRNEGGKLVPDAIAGRLLTQVGMVSGAVWSDLDCDGYPELILACEWGPVRIFHNRHGELSPWDPEVGNAPGADLGVTGIVPGKLSSLTGWWTSVSTGDFDGDGLPDLVVGNWGLNTGYRASLERPLRIYYGDLTGNGVMDVIEAYYPSELQTEMPRRSRNALAQAIPSLGDWFPTHTSFSTATIADALSPLSIKPNVVSATTLVTTVLLNRGDHFEAVPLPPEVQFAPVFGMGVGDFDGDGSEDIYLGQNFFGMRMEWPRTDAGLGLLLKGDGHGRFSAMPAQTSGIRVYGEQRGISVGDMDHDGRLEIVAAQYGAAVTVWQNLRAKPGIRVRFQGPPGNPSGYGASASLKSEASIGPAHEVHAGGGYWSQDSATVVLGLHGRPDAVRVKWPGGAVSEVAIPAGSREVLVRSDAANKSGQDK